MVPLAWSEAFHTGVAFIDEGHQRIFQLINALEHPGRREGDPTLDDSLAVFLGYAGRHFEEEEALMRFLEYPGFEVHHADHLRAVAWVTTLKAQADSGLLDRAAIAAFASDWVREHILHHDFPFIKWTREARAGTEEGRLAERRNRV